MKLFYKAGACSLFPHIVLAELNHVYELEAVDLGNKTWSQGDFRQVNPKGSVPALRMDNGEVLTEGAVIAQYLCEMKPEQTLMPKAGSLENLRCREWLNYLSTELHKGFGPLFWGGRAVRNDEGRKELTEFTKEVLSTRMNFISEKLGQNDWLMGKTFTLPDAYLFTILNWTAFVGLDLSRWSNLTAFMERTSKRPAVQRALKEEGLLK
jgi:glutathione S-transferase